MGPVARASIAISASLLTASFVFTVSAFRWEHRESRTILHKRRDSHGRAYLLVRVEGNRTRPEYLAVPAAVFDQARVGDLVVTERRRIPDFEVQTVHHQIFHSEGETIAWSRGSLLYWLSCVVLSLLAGTFVYWVTSSIARGWSHAWRKAKAVPVTRLGPLADEVTPFAH